MHWSSMSKAVLFQHSASILSLSKYWETSGLMQKVLLADSTVATGMGKPFLYRIFAMSLSSSAAFSS